MVMRTRGMSIVFLSLSFPLSFPFSFPLMLSSLRFFSPDTLIPCYCPFLIASLVHLIYIKYSYSNNL